MTIDSNRKRESDIERYIYIYRSLVLPPAAAPSNYYGETVILSTYKSIDIGDNSRIYGSSGSTGVIHGCSTGRERERERVGYRKLYLNIYI